MRSFGAKSLRGSSNQRAVDFVEMILVGFRLQSPAEVALDKPANEQIHGHIFFCLTCSTSQLNASSSLQMQSMLCENVLLETYPQAEVQVLVFMD